MIMILRKIHEVFYENITAAINHYIYVPLMAETFIFKN
jgi:hypothetical protein